MSQKELFETQEEDNNNNNYLLLSKINYELYDMFNNRIYLINNFLLKDEKIKSEFIIDLKEMNFFNFFLIYILKTRKNSPIENFLKLNKAYFRLNNNQIKRADGLYYKLRLLFPKFLIICIFNSYELSKIIKVNKKTFTETIFEIIQIYYLNNLIDNENLINIIRMKLISSLYKEDNKIFNKEFLNIKNKTIVNVFAFEEVIHFLLSFKSKSMTNEKIIDFSKVISKIVSYIEEQFLTHNNIFLLSNMLWFYRLLELSQISFECLDYVIPLLKKVYKYCFKIEYYLSDLSELFLLKENEKINQKNNNLIAKNHFLYHLFFFENSTINKEKYLIKNGFVFNDNPNNGIILNNNNSFDFPNESFSIVISFCLINNIIKNRRTHSRKYQNNKRYTIFSLSNNNNNNDNTTSFNIFIQNNILKMTLLGEIYELFTNIEYNKSYVLWQFLLGNKTFFYLNEKKIIKEDLLYPKGMYDINFGFNNNKNPNNFVGMLGTFILFNKSFMKDDDENNKYYEKILFELKCNYEDIIYTNYRTEFSFLEPNIQENLDDLSQDNISSFIEVIISSKSIMSDDFCCCSDKTKKAYKANYFMDNNNLESMISFKDENIDINLDSYNFNCKNCLVTYPFHFNFSFPIFINNNGIKFLEMELYYFIGIIDFYTNNTNNNNISVNRTKGETPNSNAQNISNQEKTNINEMQQNLYHKIKYIVTLFLFCLENIDKTQEKKNQKDIENFFCTLNNLISLYSKHNIKIDLVFLNLILSRINLLINKKKFFDFCGFLFEFESYDVNNDTILNILFRTLYVYLEENVDDFLKPSLFSKLLSFEKIYLYDNLKESKKKYSKFIRKCISLSLENNNLDCFSIFINHLKELKGIRNINITEEEIIEEPETIKNKTNQGHMHISSDVYLNNEDSDLNNKKREEKETKENNNLLLMYKYLKNLFLSLKNNTYQIFLNFCNEDDENLINFLNEEFNYLSIEYDIRKINSEISDYNAILMDITTNDDSDPLNGSINDKRIELNEKMEYSESYIMKLKYSELIKALCIRLLDDIIFDDNIKSLKDELSKEEVFTIVDKKKRKSFKSSSSDIYKSFAYFNLTLPTQNFIGGGDTFYSNSNNSSTRYLDINPIESILMKKFDFYYDFTISPYTFNSFFLLLFRNLSNEEKMKYIKNIQIDYHYKKLFSKQNCNYFVSTLIILKLIKRVGEEDLDTYFMDKLELLKYVYKRFNNLFLDILNYYIEKKDEYKSTIKKLFCKEDYGTIFYLSILDSLKKHKDLERTYFAFNNKHLTYNKENNKNNFIDNFIEKVKKSLYEIIDKTIYELTGSFYFNLLFEIYIKDYDDDENCDFAINIIEYIINKFIEYENKNSSSQEDYVNEKVEINNYNLVALIYKITFFIPKRKYLIENTTFIQSIVLYLSEFCNKSKLLYLKILFPIGEKNDSNKRYSKKLILEILFEIFIELYLEFKKNLNQQKCQMFEAIINELLIKNSSRINKNKNNSGSTISSNAESSNEKINNKKESLFQDCTICFIMDELSINEQNSVLVNFRKNILKKYLINYNSNEHTFSVIILFLIKLTIYIKKLEEISKNCNLLDFLIKVCDLLCKDAKRLQQKYATFNPLVSKNENFRDLYNEFLYFIVKDKAYIKDELISKINKYPKDLIIYTFFSYNISKEEEKTRIFSVKSQLKYYSTERKKSHYSSYSNLADAINPGNKGLEKEDFFINKRLTSKFNLHKLSMNSNSSNDLHSTNNIKYRIGSSNGIRNEKNKNSIKIMPKFRKFFIRNHFSLYFLKFLTYDEDFIIIKKIYNYLYNNEIEDINDYGLNYPSKLKNRLGNNYVKHFLKKDFSFTSSKYFKYSHKCIYKRNFIPKSKYLFPEKKLLEDLMYAKISLKIKENKNLIKRSCELITYKGAVFGNIYIFDNCILFISDLENDKRKENDILDYVCCSMDFDFLDEAKNKIIDFNETKEVISHKFLYSWISLEIFMKDGKSYLLNFFNEETCNYIIDIFKSNNIFVVSDIKEYFDKKDYVKKWKDGQKSTYEYLLILNKLSSRTYNDSNQYPVMPWIFLKNNNIRNFDIPMSVQNETAKNRFLKIAYDNSSKQNRWHSNHYSTSAYICYYLMRANPFTDSMIKFQSNNFDVPDRQFFDLGQTLTLCEFNNNNREPIPELFTIPEVYINLNNNDFGKLSMNEKERIHNVHFAPYAYNAYEFTYKFRYMLNNDEEVNSKINLWFDFIFGINQYNKDNISGKGLRNFNKYSYAQNVNIKNNINTLKNKQKSESFIYNNVKYIIGMVISFGQCPFQLLSYEHPKRIYTNGIHNILLSSAGKTKLNENEKDLRNNTTESITTDNSQNSDDRKMLQKLYDNNNNNNNIIYFRKSLSKNNLYCILNNKEIEIYQKDSGYIEYKYKRKIIFSKNYLLFKKTEHGYPILKPKYLFCELKEEHFIFCRYLDNSIKLVMPNLESNFLLDSFVTTIIRIDERDFITGDNKGKLIHWRINFDNPLKIKLKLLKKINSNNNSITAIAFSSRLNIVISADKTTAIIRSFYDFEFLTYINIHDEEKTSDASNDNSNELIVDIKISNYDFIYLLINKGNNNYKLKGYSLNGICFGQYEEKITNFELTKGGKVLVGLADIGFVNVLDPIDFHVLYSRFIISNECLFYHFYFEKPNIIFFGLKDEEGSKIKLIKLDQSEIKFFI